MSGESWWAAVWVHCMVTPGHCQLQVTAAAWDGHSRSFDVPRQRGRLSLGTT